MCAEGKECKYLTKNPGCPDETRCAKYTHLNTGEEVTRCVFNALCDSKIDRTIFNVNDFDFETNPKEYYEEKVITKYICNAQYLFISLATGLVLATTYSL